MPYKLRKAPKRPLYWVVSKESGRKHSLEPIPLKRAQLQMKALYRAMNLKGGRGAPVTNTPVANDGMEADDEAIGEEDEAIAQPEAEGMAPQMDTIPHIIHTITYYLLWWENKTELLGDANPEPTEAEVAVVTAEVLDWINETHPQLFQYVNADELVEHIEMAVRDFRFVLPETIPDIQNLTDAELVEILQSISPIANEPEMGGGGLKGGVLQIFEGEDERIVPWIKDTIQNWRAHIESHTPEQQAPYANWNEIPPQLVDYIRNELRAYGINLGMNDKLSKANTKLLIREVADLDKATTTKLKISDKRSEKVFEREPENHLAVGELDEIIDRGRFETANDPLWKAYKKEMEVANQKEIAERKGKGRKALKGGMKEIFEEGELNEIRKYINELAETPIEARPTRVEIQDEVIKMADDNGINLAVRSRINARRADQGRPQVQGILVILRANAQSLIDEINDEPLEGEEEVVRPPIIRLQEVDTVFDVPFYQDEHLAPGELNEIIQQAHRDIAEGREDEDEDEGALIGPAPKRPRGGNKIREFFGKNPNFIKNNTKKAISSISPHIGWAWNKLDELQGGGPIPERNILQQIATASYSNDPPILIGDYTLVSQTHGLVFYSLKDTIVVGIRGTQDYKDIIADARIPFGTVASSDRFNDDLHSLLEIQGYYPPIDYDYYGVAHSLGGVILDIFLDMGLLKNGVSYNPAIQRHQVKETTTKNERIYHKSDPLYKLAKPFLSVEPEIRDVGSPSILEAHKLSRFEGGKK